ncbi:MAG: alpha/beta hydrolase [Ferruginibacter sp.]
MKVYFISGLAADHRVFLHLNVPEGCEIVYLDWIPPVRNESLSSYALRLAESIDTKENFALVGLSMGGMIAIEIAKKYAPATTILLSSVATNDQFPAHFKLAYALKLHRLLPMQVLKSASILKRLFTLEDPDDKVILRQVIRDSDPNFIRWAIGAILEWKNDVVPEHLWQIHGSKDEILPWRNTKPTHTIQNGTHMMVMTKAADLNKLLKEALIIHS